MPDNKYGRIYTDDDVQLIVAAALRVDDPATVDVAALVRSIEGEGFPLRFPPDEPVFVLRGKDVAAPETIAAMPGLIGADYLGNAHAKGASTDHLRACRAAAERMREWQEAHPERVKVPD